MAHTYAAEQIDRHTGHYGQGETRGLLVDHLVLVLEAGARLHVTPSGRNYVSPPEGGKAVAVLCGDLVEVWDEDGRGTGRCGLPVLHDDGACPGHAEERRRWLALSEPQRLAWEMARG